MKTFKALGMLLCVALCKANTLRGREVDGEEIHPLLKAILDRHTWDKDAPIPILPEDFPPGIFPPPGTPYNKTEDFDLETGDEGIVGGVGLTRNTPGWITFPPVDSDKNCGGSLVTPDTVMTAAHCYQNCKNVFFDCETPCPQQVRIGSPFRSKGGIIVDVLPYSCVVHPNFKAGTKDNLFDVAIYRLAKPVFLEKYGVINANPNFPSFEDSGEYDDSNTNKFDAFGFGRFSNNEKSGAEVLRRTKLTYWDNCTGYRGGNYYNPNYHVCAYAQDDEGICKGDSGGPMVYFDKGQNIDFVAGIMSFLGREVEPYCAQGNVDYFTRVGTFSNWIYNETVRASATGGAQCARDTGLTNWFLGGMQSLFDGIQSVGMYMQGWL